MKEKVRVAGGQGFWGDLLSAPVDQVRKGRIDYLMLDYLAEKLDKPSLSDAAQIIEAAVYQGFSDNRIRPVEFGGDMGTRAVTKEVISLVNDRIHSDSIQN